MSDLVEDLKELRRFLNGEGELEGLWFGEMHPKRIGAFWWRKHLTAVDEAASTILRLEQENEELRLSVAESAASKRSATEDYTSGTPPTGFGLSPDQARARIEELKQSQSFGARYLAREAEATAEMERLHRIAFG